MPRPLDPQLAHAIANVYDSAGKPLWKVMVGAGGLAWAFGPWFGVVLLLCYVPYLLLGKSTIRELLRRGTPRRRRVPRPRTPATQARVVPNQDAGRARA